MKKLFLVFMGSFISFCSYGGTDRPLVIQEQGSFAIGGTIAQSMGEFDSYKLNPEGQTLHGDHASIFYQKPAQPHQYPLVFLHGARESKRTWETTPDGREGFQNIFLRKDFSVYLVDQPRRGTAGKTTVSTPILVTPDEQYWFNVFRLGIWPNFFKGVQFSNSKEALEQYFRQMTPNTGPFDNFVITESMKSLFNKIGDGVLITHSQGGGVGWLLATQTEHIKGIVAYEPGSGFIFPKSEMPKPMPTFTGTLEPVPVNIKNFNALTKIPIIIYYGDNIPEEFSPNPAQDQWRVRLQMAKLFVQTINKYGGDAQLIHLPKIGIYGNTHFPFSDLNNQKIAELMADFLREKNLQ